jgi:hypothetical protein
MSVVMVEVDGDGPISVPVNLGLVRLPRRAGVLLDADPWPEFVAAGRFPAESAARTHAARGAARVLVACPALVSPARSMLALAVGRVLVEQRRIAGVGPVPVLMCGARPRCAYEAGGVIVPHLVTVRARAGAQHRPVWEIADTRRLPGLLDSSRVALAAVPKAA